MESFGGDLSCILLGRTFVFSMFGESRRFELLKEKKVCSRVAFTEVEWHIVKMEEHYIYSFRTRFFKAFLHLEFKQNAKAE